MALDYREILVCCSTSIGGICGAVVLAADSPPLNEDLTGETGILVRSKTSRRTMGFVNLADVGRQDLAGAIERALGMNTGEVQRVAQTAR